MTTAEATFTDLLRHPNEVTNRLVEGDVIIHRRDEEDLRLSIASRAAAVEESVAVVGRLMVDALADEEVRDRLSQRVALPWLRFLPAPERERFYRDFFECIEGAVAVGTLAPIARLLDQWQATAAIYADPDLAARLRRPITGEGGRVPRPTA
jgi:hypothetical protein